MRNIVLLLLTLLLLGGCAPQILAPDDQPAPTDPRIEQAQQLFEQQQYLAAAELYRQLAATLAPPGSSEMALLGAEAYLKAGDARQAEQLLQGLDLTQLPGALQRQRLLLADLALRDNHPDQALELLSQPLTAESPEQQVIRYHQLRAEALRLSGNLLESARELELVDPLLGDPQLRLENQRQIIETLTNLTDTALELLQPDPPGVQGGWMELARVLKGYDGDSSVLEPRIEGWRERFPDHPALPGLLETYLQKIISQYRRVEHLAVMLPASGPYAKAAAAIRNGLLAAYYQQPPQQRPQIRFYDSTNSAEIWPLLLRAAEEGADMVIGPLNKAAVSQLANAGTLPVPVLALNQVPLDVAPPVQLYQYSLAPEDEARQIAERAWLDGHTRAAALVPEGAWGNRILEAFRDRWERLGGQLNSTMRYDPKKVDFSTPIRQMLDLDQSDARRSRLQRLLGEKLEFEPRRRRDIDFILLAATPEKGRQIRPQLQFHRAADIPVYGSSRSYSGVPDSKADIDLEGLRFPDLPWLLEAQDKDPLSRQKLAELLPESRSLYRRLYAMGMDSYRLPAHLNRLAANPTERFDGRTGQLYLDSLRRVHRQLLWAEMKRGLPRVIGYAPRMYDELEQSEAPRPTTPLPEPPQTRPEEPRGAGAENRRQPAPTRDAEAPKQHAETGT